VAVKFVGLVKKRRTRGFIRAHRLPRSGMATSCRSSTRGADRRQKAPPILNASFGGRLHAGRLSRSAQADSQDGPLEKSSHAAKMGPLQIFRKMRKLTRAADARRSHHQLHDPPGARITTYRRQTPQAHRQGSGTTVQDSTRPQAVLQMRTMISSTRMAPAPK